MSDFDLFLKLKIFRIFFILPTELGKIHLVGMLRESLSNINNAQISSKQKSTLAFMSSLQLNFDEIKFCLQNQMYFIFKLVTNKELLHEADNNANKTYYIIKSASNKK